MERLASLRSEMQKYGIDAYIIVSDDYHASEYVGDYFKCREYVSGFDGSAGTLVVTAKEAGLWTDGRYFIQAKEQLDGTGIELRGIGEEGVPTILEYLKSTLRQNQCIGYDGRTIRAAYAGVIKEHLKGQKIKYEETMDLVNNIWPNRPPMPTEPIWILADEYAGKSRVEKLKDLRAELKKGGADAFLLASLDDIAWLYNIRGNDISYNPVALAYTLVTHERAELFVNQQALGDDVRAQLQADGVEVKPYLAVYQHTSELKKGMALMLDENAINVALRSAVPVGVSVINQINPTTLAKAVKNPVEMEHVRNAHIKDGVAVTKLIYWLKTEQSKLTELDVCRKLEELRQLGEGYVEPSFAPIAASGAHGAIVHYEPTGKNNIPLVENSFLLLDTGGQYLDGTTDITRTIACGQITEQQQVNYTAVLRGNLNLAAAKFKHGCSGANFDYLARAPLWEMGLDYNHGTGHGVGFLLNVHEGPNAFRMKGTEGAGGVFEEGMITSNEPGFYLEGEYGIRLENLLLCKKDEKNEYGQFLTFETLTLVPFDRSCIKPECMSQRELDCLNSYHKRVYEMISPYLTEAEREWLEKETMEITHN